jgi:hypothetical protein
VQLRQVVSQLVRTMEPECEYIQRAGADLCVVQVVKAEAAAAAAAVEGDYGARCTSSAKVTTSRAVTRDVS